MAAHAVVFILFLISHAGDTLALNKIKEFPSQAACEKAASGARTAIGLAAGDVEIGCLSGKSLEDFKAANR
jgi:hypothetical protein